MFGKSLTIASAILLVSLAANVNADEYDVDALCNVMIDGTKLASIVSCQTFYTCKGGVGIKENCLASQSFDKDTQTCIPSSQVNCIALDKNPCSSTKQGHIASTENCAGWIYCDNYQKMGSGTCAPGQHFENGVCAWGPCDNSNIAGTEVLSSICQVVPINTFFGTTTRCSQWKKCVSTTEGYDIRTGDCPNNLAYNVRTGTCVDNIGDVCARIENAGQPCEAGALVPDADTCSVYYTCVSEKLVRMNCALGQYFDVTTNTCVIRSNAVPISTCNRCEFFGRSWVNQVDPNCRKFYTCNGGGQNSCPVNSFFNEARQACITVTTSTPTNLEEYQDNNPVCQLPATTIAPGTTTVVGGGTDSTTEAGGGTDSTTEAGGDTDSTTVAGGDTESTTEDDNP